MLAGLLATVLACTPQPNNFCTREFMPVCGNGTTYNNICLAQAAGFHGKCEVFLKNGRCDSVSTVKCAPIEFFSEKGFCIAKPWSDFTSCEEEKTQGACPNGNDPNPWVSEHCATTCGVHTSKNRLSDGP